MTSSLIGVDGRAVSYGPQVESVAGYGAFAIPDPNPYPFPAAPAVINGTLVTLDRYAKQPSLLLKVIQDLSSQQFLTDSLFRPTTANGGSIIYDVALSQDLYIDVDANRQPQYIAPGALWPEVGFTALTSLVQPVSKYGAQFHLSYEQVRRDSRDIMANNIRRLTNTLIRNSDMNAVAMLTAGVTAGTIPSFAVPAGGAWNGATPTFINDVTTAIATINANELNYTADTVWGNPLDFAALLTIKDLYLHLPRESTAGNPLLNPQLNGLLGMSWYSSRRWPRYQLGIGSKQQLGALATEVAPYTRTTDDPLRERWTVQSGRVEATVVTDPQSFVMIKQINN
jgi:hypothetical protein